MRIILVALAVCTLHAFAFAQSPPRGAESCSGCHGVSGTALPSLDALKASDIVTAMAAFRGGTREATVMDRIAKGFSPEEDEAIAAWLASHGRKP